MHPVGQFYLSRRDVTLGRKRVAKIGSAFRRNAPTSINEVAFLRNAVWFFGPAFYRATHPYGMEMYRLFIYASCVAKAADILLAFFANEFGGLVVANVA